MSNYLDRVIQLSVHFELECLDFLVFLGKTHKGRRSRRSESDPESNMTSSDPDFSESELWIHGQNLTQ